MISSGFWRFYCGNLRIRLLVILLLIPVSSGTLPSVVFAQENLATARAQRAVPSPRAALWRAAAVPGWGQVYNRQYLKLPVVYGGLGLLIAGAIRSNNQYLLYRHAWLYATQPDVYGQYREEAARFSRLIELGRQDLLRQQRDVYRRNRDLSYIGIGLFHGLTILDAYVSAHLREFDIDEDLSVRIDPTYAEGPGIRASVRWN